MSFQSVFYENMLLLKDNPVKVLHCNILNLSCTSGRNTTWNCRFPLTPIIEMAGTEDAA